MHRFFLPQENFSPDAVVTLADKKEIHHLKNVLRLKIGARVSVFNGTGGEGEGTIAVLLPQKVEIRLDQVRPSNPKNISLVIAAAIPKKAKFETIIEKCTELGVDEIIPLITSRTEAIPQQARLSKKQKRYQMIAINAAKQCQRRTLPVIHHPAAFKKVLASITPTTFACIAGVNAPDRLSLIDALAKRSTQNQILFLIGPEGDFTPEEIAQARAAGCLSVSLGSTVLKVDTAVLMVAAASRLFYNL